MSFSIRKPTLPTPHPSLKGNPFAPLATTNDDSPAPTFSSSHGAKIDPAKQFTLSYAQAIKTPTKPPGSIIPQKTGLVVLNPKK